MSLKTFSCSTKITPRHRWEDRIKIDVQEIAWNGGEGGGRRTGLIWCRKGNKRPVLTTVISILVSKKCGEFLDRLKNYQLLM